MTTLVARNSKAPFNDTAIASRIHTPFILVQAEASTDINCQTTEDQSEWALDFNGPFELHNEIDVLRQMEVATLL